MFGNTGGRKRGNPDLEAFYADFSAILPKRHRNSPYQSAQSAEISWLYQAGDCEDDEDVRIGVVMALARFQLDAFGELTETMVGEVELYDEEFSEGKFDDILAQEDYDLIEKDIALAMAWINQREAKLQDK